MPIVLVTPTPITNTYTSGTVGNTVIDTAAVLEHAFRRVKVHPSQQTPETVQIAKENLYLLLLNMATVGLGELVSCVLLGLLLVRAIERSPRVLELLQSPPPKQ